MMERASEGPQHVPTLWLVSLPWQAYDMPSVAIAALSAHIQAVAPMWTVCSCSSQVDIASRIGFPLYEMLQSHLELAELVPMALYYPSRRELAASRFAFLAAQLDQTRHPKQLCPHVTSWSGVYDHCEGVLDTELDALAGAVSATATVLGMTSTIGLFTALVLARKVKALRPDVTTVLGGAVFTGRIAASISEAYEVIDVVVHGEGEDALRNILESLRNRCAQPSAINLPSAYTPPRILRGTQSSDMSQLPIPDYDEFAEAAKRHAIKWVIPLEGSRGCWWGRCAFCSLNAQWNGYREKTVRRVTDEVTYLTTRYNIRDVVFVDNLLNRRDLTDMAAELQQLRKGLRLCGCLRATATSLDVLRLWFAGLTDLVVGIESFSDGCLDRIGKGTSVIDNLAIMKTCCELRITIHANVLVGIPGTTEKEVAECAKNISRYACIYQPCTVTQFQLGIDSPIYNRPEAFGVRNVRHTKTARVGVPSNVLEAIYLCDWDYEESASVSWQPVIDACTAWMSASHGSNALVYEDNKDCVRVGACSRVPRERLLTGSDMELFRYCCVIRPMSKVRQFLEALGYSRAAIQRSLAQLEGYGIVYSDGQQVLTLPVARSPAVAARRMCTDLCATGDNSIDIHKRLPVLEEDQ